jgi:hypothetical protein
MVVGTTKGEDRPMIFLTAPPNIEQTRGSRFRVQRIYHIVMQHPIKLRFIIGGGRF